MTNTTKNYVDNEAFYKEIIEWREKYEENNELRISDSIAEKLMLICTRITYRPNFRNYTYREEMAEDALENSIRYFKTFNPEKSNNPFAYFSSVASMACIARINKEKRQVAIKAKYIQGMAVDEVPMAYGEDANNLRDSTLEMKDYLTSYYDFDLDGYEQGIKDKKIKSQERKQAKLDAINGHKVTHAIVDDEGIL